MQAGRGTLSADLMISEYDSANARHHGSSKVLRGIVKARDKMNEKMADVFMELRELFEQTHKTA